MISTGGPGLVRVRFGSENEKSGSVEWSQVRMSRRARVQVLMVEGARMNGRRSTGL